MTTDPTLHLQAGTVLHGTYRIERFIHAGGFGCVYEARHTFLGTRYSIKEFFVKDRCNRSGDGSVTVGTQGQSALVERLRKKFIEEAKAIYGMSHPNIVRVWDVFEENGTAYYVMDYIDGPSLSDKLKRNGALAERAALRYIRQTADALQYVHGQNRLHLDVKPGNIMVNGNDEAILIDFGVSKQYDEVGGENTSTLMGKTPGFAPIEQMGNNVKKFTPATDIYAMGATLYKLLTNVTPPDASDRVADADELVPLSGKFSSGIRTAVAKAMEIKPKDRPQSISEFLVLLDGKGDKGEDTFPIEKTVGEKTVLDAKVSSEAQKKPTPQPTPPLPPDGGHEGSKTKKGLWIGLGAAAVVAIVFALTINKGDRNAEPMTSDVSVGLAETKNGVDIEMVPVEGGTFTMGCTNEQGDDCWDDEKPAHSVTLSGFYMGKYEVTQAQWKAVMGSNPSRFKGDNLPVEQVSWYDCQDFIRKLNQLTGEKFRLPTEAEWEYAARGGNKSRGYKYAGGNNIDEVAWYDGNSGERTHPVGKKRPNELGLYDMSGNVWEWCSDWYDEDYYGNSPQNNPQGPASGSSRVFRGGSWDYLAILCRSAFRYYLTPGYRNDLMGFRLVSPK